jgi:hypothetical protein
MEEDTMADAVFQEIIPAKGTMIICGVREVEKFTHYSGH